jgi:Hypothetical protein (DUF2513)
MKRDLSLVREILLRLEPLSANPDQSVALNIGKPPLDIPNYTDEQIVYHIRIMEDGGLISYYGGVQTPGLGFQGPGTSASTFLSLTDCGGKDTSF